MIVRTSAGPVEMVVRTSAGPVRVIARISAGSAGVIVPGEEAREKEMISCLPSADRRMSAPAGANVSDDLYEEIDDEPFDEDEYEDEDEDETPRTRRTVPRPVGDVGRRGRTATSPI